MVPKSGGDMRWEYACFHKSSKNPQLEKFLGNCLDDALHMLTGLNTLPIVLQEVLSGFQQGTLEEDDEPANLCWPTEAGWLVSE